jgi:hypothetical protein
MREFVEVLGPFVYGFAVGYFAYPVWNILKKIWAEAKQARKEW